MAMHVECQLKGLHLSHANPTATHPVLKPQESYWWKKKQDAWAVVKKKKNKDIQTT
jgi:hypothetical protein